MVKKTSEKFKEAKLYNYACTEPPKRVIYLPCLSGKKRNKTNNLKRAYLKWSKTSLPI